jgi:hypothetical protein
VSKGSRRLSLVCARAGSWDSRGPVRFEETIYACAADGSVLVMRPEDGRFVTSRYSPTGRFLDESREPLRGPDDEQGMAKRAAFN